MNSPGAAVGTGGTGGTGGDERSAKLLTGAPAVGATAASGGGGGNGDGGGATGSGMTGVDGGVTAGVVVGVGDEGDAFPKIAVKPPIAGAAAGDAGAFGTSGDGA